MRREAMRPRAGSSARGVGLALLAGVLFGVGLGVGGMLDPGNVVAFLDVTGAWNPRLAFVLGGAIAVFMPVHRWSVRRPGEQAALRRLDAPSGSSSATGTGVRDPRLVIGSALFGVGWGLVGYCPGPALVSTGAALIALAAPGATDAATAAGATTTLAFVGFMVVGMLLFEAFERARRTRVAIGRRAGVDA